MDSIEKTKTSLERSTIILLIITWISFILYFASFFLSKYFDPSFFDKCFLFLFLAPLFLAPISLILAIVCTAKDYGIKYLLLSLPPSICSLAAWTFCLWFYLFVIHDRLIG